MKKKRPKSAPAAVPACAAMCHTPLAFLAGTRPAAKELKLALGLDLGTNTGYAATYFDPTVPIDITKLAFYTGQLDLSLGKYDSRGLIGVRLWHYLCNAAPDIVFYENVRHSPRQGPARLMASIVAQATSTAEFFGGLKQTLSTWGTTQHVPMCGINIGDIKRRATGHGQADKVAVIKAWNALFGLDLDETTYETTGVDNMCDATFALIIGLEQYGNGVACDTQAECGCVGITELSEGETSPGGD